MEGPTLKFSQDTHATKYRGKGESFREAMTRIADALKDDQQHFHEFRSILLRQAFLPPGRVQAAMGSPRLHTPYNCFVSGDIPDSMEGIMDSVKQAALTMKMGGGIGYDFSSIRPRGDWIASQETYASGAVSFMKPFDAVCQTIASAGNRRGAQMAGLRVDHPDIEEFIAAKQNTDNLTQFNVSVLVTDEFMEAMLEGRQFPLRFEGRTYKWVDARALWDEIMRSTWDWAEPGVLFVDQANRMNNLWYCEYLPVTNPCGEQWLPEHGACLLGSFNLVKYLVFNKQQTKVIDFDYEQLWTDIQIVYRAMDNVVDRAAYPLPEQEAEAKNKRRMGLGITGLANAGEALGFAYGSSEFLRFQEEVEKLLTYALYTQSAVRARQYGAFPLCDNEKLVQSNFIQKLPPALQDFIREYGLRNSHLTSIAPTGTISLCADNVSSGIEPPYSLGMSRKVRTFDGVEEHGLVDYASYFLGVDGKTVMNGDVTVEDHLNVLEIASRWNDSSVSKTVNIDDSVTFEQFKDVYVEAWKRGCKGCTTFRASGKRMGILSDSQSKGSEEATEGGACVFDPELGTTSCGE